MTTDDRPNLTHANASGEVNMVDVGDRDATRRSASAAASITMAPETAEAISTGTLGKGEVLATARLAGIMAAKRTPETIPLCHHIALDKVSIEIDVDSTNGTVSIVATAATHDRTGVEMEAMVAAATSALTIYDMVKAIDPGMVIGEIKLISKDGGRSGRWNRD